MVFVIAIIFILLVAFYIFSFNVLTSSQQNVNESWADIDVQLKRRQDLIPNLVNIVKGYATHEEAIFTKIAEIRSKAISLSASDLAQKSVIEKELENDVHQLLALAESYPDLKANEHFLKLQQELVNTEDQIASARRIYNNNVAKYNTKASVFPINIVAKINHFKLANFFQNQ